MFYIITYLYVGTLIVILSNLSVFLLRKNEDNLELPFVISWFGFVMNLFSFSLKNFLTAINILIFYPFLNLYLAYESFTNLRYKKSPLEFSNDDVFDGYNLEISDKTIEITKNILKNSNINFKEKYLKNNIKVALIFSLRNIQTTITDLELFKNDNLENEKIKVIVDFNYDGLKYWLNQNLKANVANDEFMSSLKEDLINYLKNN